MNKLYLQFQITLSAQVKSHSHCNERVVAVLLEMREREVEMKEQRKQADQRNVNTYNIMDNVGECPGDGHREERDT